MQRSILNILYEKLKFITTIYYHKRLNSRHFTLIFQKKKSYYKDLFIWMIKFIKHAYNFNAVKVVENRRFLSKQIDVSLEGLT